MSLHVPPGPFQFRWLTTYNHNPFYCHHQIRSGHLSHCCHILPWLLVWSSFTIIFCLLLYIYPGNTGTLSPLFMCSLWCVLMTGYIMPCGSLPFVCTLNSLSPLCRLTRKHWTSKIFVRYILSSGCLRFGQFSQLAFIQCMGLCVFSLPNSLLLIISICNFPHYQIENMNH